jgi:hypothetical protein
MSDNGTGGKASKSASADGARPFDRAALESVFGMSDAILNAWQSINAEWLALVRAELDYSRNLARSLAECRDPLAALALHLDGAQASLTRYVTAATKSSSTVTTLASQAWTSARDRSLAA